MVGIKLSELGGRVPGGLYESIICSGREPTEERNSVRRKGVIVDSGFYKLGHENWSLEHPMQKGEFRSECGLGHRRCVYWELKGKAGVPDRSAVKEMGGSVHTLFLGSEKPRFASTQTFSPEHCLS